PSLKMRRQTQGILCNRILSEVHDLPHLLHFFSKQADFVDSGPTAEPISPEDFRCSWVNRQTEFTGLASAWRCSAHGRKVASRLDGVSEDLGLSAGGFRRSGMVVL